MEAILKREIIADRTICRILGAATFVILTALAAFVRVPLPFTPVPLTLQTMFVLLAGAFLGSRLGVVSQFSYLVLGAAGMPVFSGASFGVLYLFGPTGGYLLGFVLAAFLLGKVVKFCGNNFFVTFTLFCLADFVILACGMFWLKVILKVSLSQAILAGFLPFVAGDLIKAFFAALIYFKLRSRISQIW